MLKLGIVGTSVISELMLDAVFQHDKVEPHAIVSRSNENGMMFKEKFNIPHHYTTIDEALQSDIDAVYIASPNALHYAQAKVALLSKKHVLLEKPFTSTVQELQELFELAKQENLILMEAMKTIYLPNFLELKKYLSNNDEIKYVEIFYCKRSDRYDLVLKGEEPNIFSLAMSGGSLADLGVYCIWMALELFGIPNSWTHTAEILSTGVDGSGEILFEYETFNINIRHSKTGFLGNHAIITHNDGEIIVPDFSIMPGFLNEKNEFISLEDHKNPMFYELDLFYQSIKQQSNIDEFYQKSYQVMKIMEDCRYQANIIYPADGISLSKNKL